MIIKENTMNPGKNNINTLNEERIDVMSDREKKLQKKLYNLLKDDGKGHYHAMYAKRLKKYDINIVPLGKEPSTAAISFDEGIIYINEGFLTVDEDWLEKKRRGEITDKYPPNFYQLNVLMRHELCHDLLMHQIRMMNHITDIPWSHLKMSSSIHDIINIIEDFEISNKKYSAEDKKIVKHMQLNGKVISGLVTEDHRKGQLDLSLEDMWEALKTEYMAGGENGMLAKKSSEKDSFKLNRATQHMHDIFSDIASPAMADSLSELRKGLTDQIRKANNDKHLELPKEQKAIIDALEIIETDSMNTYSKADIVSMLDDIRRSSALKAFDVVSPITGEVLVTLYTPEERWLAEECLKIIMGNTPYKADYDTWYKKIQQIIENAPEITADDVKALLDGIS